MGCEAATVKLVSALVQVVSLKSTNEMGLETTKNVPDKLTTPKRNCYDCLAKEAL